jgi:phosphate transport system substrate-binding protein
VPLLFLVAVLLCGACTGPGGSSGGGHDVVLSAGAGDRATLAGAGSTFATTLVDEWVRLYRTRAPDVDIRYEAIGSGAGMARLVAGRSDFAFSEVPITPQEQQLAGWGETVQVPVLGGAVAVVYNLPGIADLRLSEETLARIFSGGITRWDNSAIKRDNPGTELPPTAIGTVHRSDASGTTLAFTRYLATAGPDAWAQSPGMSVNWPVGRDAAGSAGVLTAVSGSAGAIGYVSAGEARATKLEFALVRNPSGSFVGPTGVAVDAAMIGASGVDQNLTLRIPDRQASSAAYPITAITHLVFPVGLPPDKDAALRHFGEWILSEGQRSATRLGFAPLPLPLLVRTLEGMQNGGLKPSR